MRSFFFALRDLIQFSSIDKSYKEIIFYSENEKYWPYFKNIIRLILKETNLKICYISSSHKDPGLKINNKNIKKFFIGMGSIRNYFFSIIDSKIVIMTMPDLGNFQIVKSNSRTKYAYIQHAMMSLHMVYNHRAFDNFDYIFCTGPHQVAEIRSMEKINNSPKKEIIKLGYTKHDELVIKSKNRNLRTRNPQVLLAPSWGKNAIIETGKAIEIIDELLNNKFKVLLRPHPQTLRNNHKLVQQIRKKFALNNFFMLDISDDNIDSMLNSNFLITDWSGIALEYAFALKRPVIFIDTPKKINNDMYEVVNSPPLEVQLRHKIGVLWNPKESIFSAIRNLENFKTECFDDLAKEYIFNIGKSDLRFTDFLINFIKKED